MNPESAAAPRVYEPAEPGVRYVLALSIEAALRDLEGEQFATLALARGVLRDRWDRSALWADHRVYKITAVEVTD